MIQPFCNASSLYSVHAPQVAVIGISLALFGIGVTALTMHIMRPDDFEWVEEERRRLQQAKERIQQNIRKASSEGP